MSAIPAVSVVLTVYNRERFAAEAIDSILAQTLADFELIIVDDGSIDNSPKVIADYAERDSRVAIVTQKNAGVAAARTAGVMRARAELIAFIDDDDISHPQRLQKQVDLMHSRSDIAACVCGFAPIEGRQKQSRKSAEIKSKWMWQGNGHLIRRDAYLTVGGYRAYFLHCEDVDFFLRFHERFSSAFINETLHFYRKYRIGAVGNLTNSPPLRILPYYAAALISAHFRRGELEDPIAEGAPPESLLHFIPELPEDYRIRLLHVARNAGRRLLVRREMTPQNLNRLIEFMNSCAAEGGVSSQKKKATRWLAYQSLRYGKFSVAVRLIKNFAVRI